MRDYTKSFRLDGKVALVTGAASGLGAEIALALASVGASVVVTDIADGGGSATVDAITAAGGHAIALRHDVVQEGDWENALSRSVKTYGRLDVLVNNAGIETAALLSQCSVEDFRRTLDVNVTGVFLGIKHAIRVMAPGGASGKGGSIVNLSSAAGIIGVTAHAAYCTSKGAVRLLTKAAAVECAQLGIGVRVNSVHPAIIPTAMGTKFLQDFVDLGLAPDYAAAEKSILGLHPMGHFGEPGDVAGAVLYLASDLAKWVTGAELAVDGGLAAA
jgi:NAD(P)-dependent dehydrogenase (short-subunit alcohol dehydrogenase family)